MYLLVTLAMNHAKTRHALLFEKRMPQHGSTWIWTLDIRFSLFSKPKNYVKTQYKPETISRENFQFHQKRYLLSLMTLPVNSLQTLLNALLTTYKLCAIWHIHHRIKNWQICILYIIKSHYVPRGFHNIPDLYGDFEGTEGIGRSKPFKTHRMHH